jgi:hypothetical protein
MLSRIEEFLLSKDEECDGSISVICSSICVLPSETNRRRIRHDYKNSFWKHDSDYNVGSRFTRRLYDDGDNASSYSSQRSASVSLHSRPPSEKLEHIIWVLNYWKRRWQS